MSSNLVIPGSVLDSAKIEAKDLLIELAVYLYDSNRLSIGQAKNLVQMDLISFQKELSSRGVFIKYDVEDLQNDMQTIERYRKNK
jgi:predicted HTH domain antitoxin